MESDFIYLTDSRRYQLKLSSEQHALQQCLMEEFAQLADSYQPLLNALRQIGPFQSYQFQGREYSLQVERQEVRVKHHSLGYIDPAELALEEGLTTDDANLYSECGLEDLIRLLEQWQQFLPQGSN